MDSLKAELNALEKPDKRLTAKNVLCQMRHKRWEWFPKNHKNVEGLFARLLHEILLLLATLENQKRELTVAGESVDPWTMQGLQTLTAPPPHTPKSMDNLWLPRNLTTNSLLLTRGFTDNTYSQLTQIFYVLCITHYIFTRNWRKENVIKENHKEEKMHYNTVQYLQNSYL